MKKKVMMLRRATEFEIAVNKANEFLRNIMIFKFDVMLAVEIIVSDLLEVTELDRNESTLLSGLLLAQFERNESKGISC